ncbi:Hypothetical predicted protein [Octopus vulgaris]|uniref:Uncharacterized protein n=1 Tax=Octopus vulgaris TaxID=6645 RepID=A0AA36BCV2_OCTVU|nr:Hypothetical predicted protein [Octopus vulgaris]
MDYTCNPATPIPLGASANPSSSFLPVALLSSDQESTSAAMLKALLDLTREVQLFHVSQTQSSRDRALITTDQSVE